LIHRRIALLGAVFLLVVSCSDDESRRIGNDGDITVSFDAGPLPDVPFVADAAGDVLVHDAISQDSADAIADSMPTGRGLYVSPMGADTNAGTIAAPLKTITKALLQAMPGDTVWLLDGVWDSSIEPKLAVTSGAPCSASTGLKLPDGVTLQAVNPRKAIIKVSGNHSVCVSTGTVRDIHFDRTAGQGGHIEISGGTSLIEGCTFAGAYGCGGSGWEAAIYAANKAKVTVVGTDAQDVNDAIGCQFVTARTESDVTLSKMNIVNGKAAVTSGSSEILVVDGSTLRLSEVSLTRTGTGSRGIGMGTATVIVETSTISGFPGGAIGVRGPASVIKFEKSTLTGNAMGVTIEGGYGGVATISANDSTFDNNGYGLLQGSGAGGNFTLKNTRMINQTRDAISMSSGAKLSIEGGEISGGKEDGIQIATGMPAPCTVLVRNLKLINNIGAGARFLCYGATVIDLGTGTSPGGNTITGNGPAPNSSGVYVTTPATVAMAVGNTWAPSVQGADAEGKYVVNGAGAKLDVTVANGWGANYRVVQGTLRLAENP
jgi:hypothetical protein